LIPWRRVVSPLSPPGPKILIDVLARDVVVHALSARNATNTEARKINRRYVTAGKSRGVTSDGEVTLGFQTAAISFGASMCKKSRFCLKAL
jgi:hypothetical protein